MPQYLVEHALQNVWCNPGQDNQYVFAPKRISRQGGDSNYTKVLHRSVTLPEQAKRFHIFQIGQLDPAVIGLFDREPSWTPERWFTMTEAINKRNIEVTVYSADGVCYPRYKTHFMYTREKALIFALEDDSRIPIQLDVDTVYLRFYSNAYFQTGDGRTTEFQMQTMGVDAGSQSSILYIQSQMSQYRAKQGIVRCYCNGRLIEDINLLTVTIGDRVEWVYDSSVKKVVTFVLGTLHSFHSTLDSLSKYLLHHPDLSTNVIDFQDDIDLFVVSPQGAPVYAGLYINRNRQSHHRMLTHRDYSVGADICTRVANKLYQLNSALGGDLGSYRLVMHVREGGYNRTLIKDHQRVFELYKLSDSLVISALTGLDALVPEWECSNLEASGYTELMGANSRDVNLRLVERAYGYNTISQVLADTPSKLALVSGLWSCTLAPALQSASTVYEYNAAGELIAVMQHRYDATYNSPHPDARMVEVLGGVGTDTPDVVFGQTGLVFDDQTDYRVYRCRLRFGVPDFAWEDITKQAGVLFTVNAKVLTWVDASDDQFLMVRSDATFVTGELNLVGNEGMFNFTLEENVNQGDGLKTHYLAVPGAQLDVFINGNSGIEGVDYIVEFPIVHIVSKRYLNQPVFESPQAIRWRSVGFCNADLSADVIDDRGWVNHGALSDNNRYDLRDDKVLRIVVGGKVKHRDELSFSENDHSIHVTHALNGLPYEIKDIAVPIGRYVQSDPYTLRELSAQVDKRVGAYMSEKLDTSGPTEPSAITQKYALVSPFFAHLVYLLINNLIPINPQSVFSTMEVVALCKTYEGLLTWDPITLRNAPDPRYTFIAPHYGDSVVVIGLHQYRFLNKAVSIYADGKINLSPYLAYNIAR